MDTLFSFLDASVTAHHAAERTISNLVQAGAQMLDETQAWKLEPGKFYVLRRENAVAAFTVSGKAHEGYAISAAHTDSPGLRLKLEQIQKDSAGLFRCGVEVYGGPLYHTWLDRDLGIAGRVFYKKNDSVVSKLVQTPAVAVVPNLAIHYNREANKGFALDPQTQLSALVEAPQSSSLFEAIEPFSAIAPQSVVSADLLLYDTQTARTLGTHGLFASGRIDNLTGCHAVLSGFLAHGPQALNRIAVFFDHEEIGSSTYTGADSSFVADLLKRLTLAQNGSEEDLLRAKAGSFLISVDSAHAVHPNYSDKHDSAYAPKLGGGPVVKSTARYHYATTARSQAVWNDLCERSEVRTQSYIMRSDLVPGSTIGPIVSSWNGIEGVDVGIPIWAMHSIRETAHSGDHNQMIRVLSEFNSKGFVKRPS